MPEQRGTALPLAFALELDLVGDLAHDARQLDALITVRASDAGPAAGNGTADLAEILVMDRSLSMAASGKINAAKRAANAAIDALDDGVLLGIIAGNHESEVLFPLQGGLIRLDPTVRAAAKRRVLGLLPDGGTAIGKWLTAAGDLFAEAAPDGAVCHAALYTDGRNEHETAQQLEAALDDCADRFVCHARGLGDDWDYAPLLRIAEALHGDARAVVEISDLAADFAQLTRDARRLVVPRVYLGLGMNPVFHVGSIRQISPVEADLTRRRLTEDGQVRFPLGAWSAGTRQYQLTLTFTPDDLEIGETLRAARMWLLTEGPDGGREPVVEGDPLLVCRSEIGAPPPPTITQLTWAANAYELGATMRACADAYLDQDYDEADRRLREAMRLAATVADEDRLRLLRAVAQEEGGSVRMRRGLKRGLVQQLGVESTRTGVVPQDAVEPDDGGRAELEVVHVCRACGEETYGADAVSCENCGTPFGGEDP
jgi:Ca-activated chloride channel family protein